VIGLAVNIDFAEGMVVTVQTRDRHAPGSGTRLSSFRRLCPWTCLSYGLIWVQERLVKIQACLCAKSCQLQLAVDEARVSATWRCDEAVMQEVSDSFEVVFGSVSCRAVNSA
jgi:hypothetical protein